MLRNTLTREAGKLEEEMTRMFGSYQTDNWKNNTVKKNQKESAFVSEVLSFNDKQEYMFNVRKSCTTMYMIHLGEVSVVQRRIDIVSDLLTAYIAYQSQMKEIIQVYDETILFILKHIAKAMGFIHPSDVLNRLLALRSLKADGIKEQIKLNEAYAKLSEDHVAVKNTLGKRNLLLSNQVYHLDVKLADLDREVRSMSKLLKSILQLSTDTSRLVFQLNGQIDALHKRVTTDRGFKTEATTAIEKLGEINTRFIILSQAVSSTYNRKVASQLKAMSRDEAWSVNANAKCTNDNFALNERTALHPTSNPNVESLQVGKSARARSRTLTVSKRYHCKVLTGNLNPTETSIEMATNKGRFREQKVSFCSTCLEVRGGNERMNNGNDRHDGFQRAEGNDKFLTSPSMITHECDCDRTTELDGNAKEASKIICFPVIESKTKTFAASQGIHSNFPRKHGRRTGPLVLPAVTSNVALDSSFKQSVLE